ncbi:hypothetical protein [Trueperella bialowiezensis]|uniref:Uncharacterized protein n=1 Tax=Trueperella bialowiezensis TaxID=312285 RepID=A0A3S4Z6D1_9ACTO|nr:hypothetical protein [Trueperella bialowiezensis]VEI14014.1 Uncharacterised protein [Trueperella bialowiezensis]
MPANKHRKVRDWHPTQLPVHRGIQGRCTVRQVARALPPESPWACELPDIPFIDLLPEPEPSTAQSFLAFLGDVTQAQLGISKDLQPDAQLADVQDFVHSYVDAVLMWVRAALDARAISPPVVKCAFSDASVSYAFGTHWLDIAVDSLASAEQRQQADAYLADLLALPGLEQWHAFPRVAYVEHRTDSTATFSNDSAPGVAPTVSDIQWWASSQMPAPVWIAYDPEVADHFTDPDDPDDDVGAVPVESTGNVYGDDAGDFPIAQHARLLRPGLRVYEFTDVASVKALVERYPARIADPEAAGLYDDWAGNDAPISVGVDWRGVAQDYDGVRLSVPAAMHLAYVPVRVNVPASSTASELGNSPTGELRGTAMLTGWTPGSTIYFTDPAAH